MEGITLVEIPYWWDRKLPSLVATIYSNKPELFSTVPTGKPIPALKPTDTRTRYADYTKSLLMTATEWKEDEGSNPTGWIMTEKYDGMRMYWNGSSFYTRQGRKIKVPESITKQMPRVPLDGELW